VKEDNKKEKGEVTRRDFLTGAGAAVVGAAVGAGIAYPLASGGTETVTTTDVVENTKTVEVPTTVVSTVPGGTVTETKTAAVTTVTQTTTTTVNVPGEAAANTVSFTVNGQMHTLMVKPFDTLRVVLREQLGLISVKDMCYGVGACGSCTVIMDGRPILSCMTLACECDGAVIETAEGIAKANHPLIETYIMNHCMQCGYCTPGFVCTSKALLDHNSNPTEDDIREALAGNLCRCATYIQHIPAVQQAAALLGGM
jgi:aerobic-type carbon monoxide dehydrogenase small subunit (CoxS/CutS family)